MRIQTVARVLIAALLSSSALANANGLTLGHPNYGGTGCPGGSVATTVSPDQKTLSILFDQFVAEAGRSAGKTIDRKSCNIAIPVHVPQGFSVSVISVDYRGYVSVPSGGEARFSAEYFFAGQRGPVRTEVFRGPADEDYMITDDLIATALVWSPCGANTNIRINASMLAKSNAKRDDVLATVDSTDVSTGLIYHLAWRRCN